MKWSDWSDIEVFRRQGSSNGPLYAEICEYAGVEVIPEKVGPGRVIVPRGYGSPYPSARTLRDRLAQYSGYDDLAEDGGNSATVMAFERANEHGLSNRITWAAIDGEIGVAVAMSKDYK
jgi:hypothetical protein